MLTVMAEYTTKNNENYVILRNQHGKWFVYNSENEKKQSNLNASEMVRYLANALEGK